MGYEVSQSSYELLKEGEYECVIEKAEVKTTPNGTEYVSVKLKVRDDVEQEYKNRYLFDSIWHDSEKPELFNRKRINGLLGSCGYKEGSVFETINDVLDAITGKHLIAVVCISYNDYLDKDENRIKYYKSTKNAPQSLESDEKVITELTDLPF